MSSVKELHDKAMEFADRADVARAQGDAERSVKMSAQALDWELAAINNLSMQSGLGWAVLHRARRHWLWTATTSGLRKSSPAKRWPGSRTRRSLRSCGSFWNGSMAAGVGVHGGG